MTGTIFTFVLCAVLLAVIANLLRAFPVRRSPFGVPRSAFPALCLFCLCVLALLFSFSARPQGILSGITNLMTLTNATASATSFVTNNSPGVALQPVYLPATTLTIQNTGINPLGANTGVLINQQVSFDGINYFTINSYSPPITNPFTYQWQPGNNPATIYLRTQTIFTNNAGIGILAK